MTSDERAYHFVLRREQAHIMKLIRDKDARDLYLRSHSPVNHSLFFKGGTPKLEGKKSGKRLILSPSFISPFIFVIESMMDCDKTFIVFSLWAAQKIVR
ncbi:hypothetical protein NPIL_679251 [Nephila pilipes]|uniref:Uncharacterized protein n=1 Tax=Nephila pilipes TaxID=299642 RepID=A0A8X6NL68_NEPPI|nr:hypothetical protein NPIL_679251 [Nephila pilipes]